MILLEQEIKNKITELKEYLTVLESRNAHYPEGHLRVSSRRGKPTYYYVEDNSKEDDYFRGERKRHYLDKSKISLAKELAQKEYDLDIRELINRDIKNLERVLKHYEDRTMIDYYDKLPMARKNLISPIACSDTEYADRWEHETFISREISQITNSVITDKGETVRSKSEKIIADALFKNHIPYKYECPVRLKEFGFVYPDFTILNVKKRMVYIWEHFGMMDNPEYVKKAISKINSYIRNGFIPGKNLIMTYETKEQLDYKVINRMIQEFLI